MADNVELQIAASAVRGHIPKDKPLATRIRQAMRFVRDPRNENTIFWMTIPNDDFRLRVALAAVMLEGSDEDKEIVMRSLQPLRMLSAAAAGIPVDFSQMGARDDILPLMKLWHESREEPEHG